MERCMRLRILIVDDSKTIRKIMRIQLEELGHYIVDEAGNGKEAIDLYVKHSPDLLTMDIQMPDMNGLEAIRKIKQIDKNTKVIMITAHGHKELVVDTIRKGADNYILKPITKDKIKESIKKIFP
jgi:two-component system chemotaxis response regulator CheY